MKPVVVGPHASVADEALHSPIAFDRWARRHQARRLNLSHRGTVATRGRHAILVNGSGDRISTVGEVVDVSNVSPFKAPACALQQVGGGGTVVAGHGHFGHVAVVVRVVVVDVLLIESTRVYRSDGHAFERTFSVGKFIRTVVTILPTVLKAPFRDFAHTVRTCVEGTDANADVIHP